MFWKSKKKLSSQLLRSCGTFFSGLGHMDADFENQAGYWLCAFGHPVNEKNEVKRKPTFMEVKQELFEASVCGLVPRSHL